MYIGEEIDSAGKRNGRRVELDSAAFTTHGVIVGMTGSGKTGLGVVLLEEALLKGIPALIIDPKGDMGNLLLNFPALRGDDFRPWIDEAEASRAGTSAEQHADTIAQRWQKGLGDWNVSQDTMRQLGTNASFAIYTPGSDAGIPIDVLGSTADDGDAIEAYVSGLLGLIGRTSDPLSSADHILLTNLIAHARAAGRELDLETLVAQVANPPIRKLGVFELDTFMPPKDRMQLAVQLNALIASPSFAAWRRGVPLDMQKILFDDAGRPRAAIMYLSHLSDSERMFIVTLVMSSIVTWMRKQPGTSELRALVYMDEVAGFAPPTAQPPSKKPMLTILKQARAHGVGMILSTQNPVDLDYKALANAGTWMIGRLQTERDKARVLEGMKSAAGDVEIGALDSMIGGLAQRQFMLHTARGGAPRHFTTRWAMSYLRGPFTLGEVSRLRGTAGTVGSGGGTAGTVGSGSGSGTAGTVGSGSGTAGTAGTSAGSGSGSGTDTDTHVQPAVAAGVRVRYLDAGAPWASDIGAFAGGRRHEAAVAARVHLRFDDAAAGLDMTETYECIWFPLRDPARPEDAHIVDYDERDLRTSAPPSISYALPDAPIGRAAFFKDIERQLRAHLLRSRTAELFVNRELKLFSRAGEDREEFVARCKATASDRADADAAKLRDKYSARRDRLEKQQRATDDRLRELDVDAKQRVQQEIIAGAGQLLSVFLGGRGSARSLAGAASRRGMTRRSHERLDTAKNKREDIASELERVEEELAEEVSQINERWDAAAERIESKRITLEQNDVTVDEVVLVWVPVES